MKARVSLAATALAVVLATWACGSDDAPEGGAAASDSEAVEQPADGAGRAGAGH